MRAQYDVSIHDGEKRMAHGSWLTISPRPIRSEDKTAMEEEPAVGNVSTNTCSPMDGMYFINKCCPHRISSEFFLLKGDPSFDWNARFGRIEAIDSEEELKGEIIKKKEYFSFNMPLVVRNGTLGVNFYLSEEKRRFIFICRDYKIISEACLHRTWDRIELDCVGGSHGRSLVIKLYWNIIVTSYVKGVNVAKD